MSNLTVLQHMPAFNINKSVRNFNMLAGRTLNVFNPDQAGFHTGLQLEEMAEKLDAIVSGCISPAVRNELASLANLMRTYADRFKAHLHTGDIMRGDRLAMLDADIDVVVVSLGSAYSISHNVDGACAEVDRANMDKFPGGVCTKDGNGKVKKPDGWRAPDLSPFVKLASE